MLKLMIFLHGPKEPGRGACFRAWILDHAVAFSRGARPTELTVNLNDQPPEVRIHASSAEAAGGPLRSSDSALVRCAGRSRHRRRKTRRTEGRWQSADACRGHA